MFNIVLVQPEIPPNTGNVIRLAANTGCTLHLVEPLGFSMDDRLLQRAGLDYHEYAGSGGTPRGRHWSKRHDPTRLAVRLHDTRRAHVRRRCVGSPATGSSSAARPPACPQRCASASRPSQRVRLPMRAGQRSLNLSNAVAVAVFEAWRQHGYAGSA